MHINSFPMAYNNPVTHILPKETYLHQNLEDSADAGLGGTKNPLNHHTYHHQKSQTGMSYPGDVCAVSTMTTHLEKCLDIHFNRQKRSK